MARERGEAQAGGPELLELRNVGGAVVRYFERIGITRISQLAGQDPVDLYDRMCEADGRRHDPCLLDTVMSAVEQADGGPARPWWDYTARRKSLLAECTAGSATQGAGN